MKRAVCSLLLGALLFAGGAVWAQQFDRHAYDELVDANSPDTIAPNRSSQSSAYGESHPRAGIAFTLAIEHSHIF